MMRHVLVLVLVLVTGCCADGCGDGGPCPDGQRCELVCTDLDTPTNCQARAWQCMTIKE